METARIRLLFSDGHLLDKSQKSEGLKRSWLLLKPHHETIYDVASHLLDVYDLHHSCPNGIILSMDDFVLPPFESTTILKDKDLIRVKRKGDKLSATVNTIEGARISKEEDIVEKQPLITGVKLLANEEFQKETGGYHSESEEDEDEEQDGALHVEKNTNINTLSKKRKASKKLESSKRKRQHQMLPVSVGDSGPKKHNESCHRDGSHQKGKSSDARIKKDRVHTTRTDEKRDDIVQSKTDSKLCEINENGEGTVALSVVPDKTKQASRSSRRKRAKRQWLREIRKAEKEELSKRCFPMKDLNPDSAARKDLNVNAASEPQRRHLPTRDLNTDLRYTKELNANAERQPDQDSDTEDDIVPIVIRPGHIYFAPYGKEKEIQQNQEAKKTFHWNGTSDKRLGQKWGKERQSAPQRNKSKSFNRNYSCRRTTEKVPSADAAADFEKLVPLIDLPKQGDTIAYRLLELSSLFCPELSSFRVGKISWYEPESNKIMLVPVPEYPFQFEKKTDEDESRQPFDVSHYKEDGSLEIEFQSLVDVRIVKRGDISPAEAGHNVDQETPVVNGKPDSSREISRKADEGPVASKDTASHVLPVNNNTGTHATVPENGKKDVWEEISQALTEKKAQLQQVNNWNNETSNKRSWSYRTRRSGAIGPTMALLRAQNGI
ncbi:hypothetical protein Nepgr_032953 [Nepenthes gracilis]|uniref:Coilin n=1 Tax=Nepenthes gracilis TaxID=150966 RepID=A0AAD3Y816_NEPGR|nr:hypothetical protein Nepgr_032953 [Nepenthes gracilis]